MRLLIIGFFVCFMAFSTSCCTRFPENYAYVIDRAADTNEKLLEQSENMTAEKKAEFYKVIIFEDNKSFRAIAETIRKAGVK